MTIRLFGPLIAASALAVLASTSAPAQSTTRVGALACDVSAGVGMILTQKQSIRCTFTPTNGGIVDNYYGRIDQFGVALGAVQQGQLVWGVIAPAAGFAR